MSDRFRKSSGVSCHATDLRGGWEGNLKSVGRPGSFFAAGFILNSSKQYAAIVRQVLEVMDQVAQGLREDDLKLIRNHFMLTSRLEYLFWDMVCTSNLGYLDGLGF